MSEPVAHNEEEVLGKAYDARLMRRLLGYVRPYGDMALGALGLIFVSSVLQLVGPLATAVALDLFVRPARTSGCGWSDLSARRARPSTSRGRASSCATSCSPAGSRRRRSPCRG